jgi:hypothetical protein
MNHTHGKTRKHKFAVYYNSIPSVSNSAHPIGMCLIGKRRYVNLIII